VLGLSEEQLKYFRKRIWTKRCAVASPEHQQWIGQASEYGFFGHPTPSGESIEMLTQRLREKVSRLAEARCRAAESFQISFYRCYRTLGPAAEGKITTWDDLRDAYSRGPMQQRNTHSVTSGE